MIKVTCDCKTMLPISEIEAFQGKLKSIDEENFNKLKKSILKYGFSFPIFVWNKKILDGHQRLAAVKKLISDGEQVKGDRLPVVSIQARDEKEAAEKLLLINSRYAEINQSGFELFVEQFEIDIVDLGNLIDIPDIEIEYELTKPVNTGDPDLVPDLPDIPKSKHGDIWLLGNHRLMCGDSTNANDIKNLFCNRKVDLCYTSPPYALGESINCREKFKGPSDKKHKKTPYLEVNDDQELWLDLMENWFECSKKYTECWAVNIQLLANNKIQLIEFINKHSSNLVDIITWYKHTSAPNFNGSILSNAFEWILVFKQIDNANRKIPFSDWHGTESNIIDIDSRKQSEFNSIHKATQIVDLPIYILSNIFNLCKSIYEPFSGTGTTIIASEYLEKTCYAIELSPLYVDVAVKRWQDYTGKKAVLENTGESFD